ncbi:unnamed protein product [Nezara viridula]|uniref:Uncharacterized protein n=1 Tax=Nezara viridula TaxID=85310 RepID=A0A9P0MW62_NEZVI|nr:unnamed protein product [Nezara viridula]
MQMRKIPRTKSEVGQDRIRTCGGWLRPPSGQGITTVGTPSRFMPVFIEPPLTMRNTESDDRGSFSTGGSEGERDTKLKYVNTFTLHGLFFPPLKDTHTFPPPPREVFFPSLLNGG